jgi:WD40 repeat protein
MKGHTGNIRCLRFWGGGSSSGGQKLLASVASGDLKPRVWDLGRGTSNTLSAHPGSIFACAWLSEALLATGCESGVVLIHNIRDVGNVVYRHELSDNLAVYSAAYTSLLTDDDGTCQGFLILGCSRGYVIVLSVSFSSDGEGVFKGEHVMSSRIHNDDVRSLSALLSGDRVLYLSTSFDHSSAIWSFQVAEALQPSGTSPVQLSSLTSHGHGDKVLSGVFVDGLRSSVITSGADGKVLLWPLST